jgi:hypothetical protein
MPSASTTPTLLTLLEAHVDGRVVWTPQVEELGNAIVKWSMLGLPGGAAYGTQRSGKTSAIKYLQREIEQYYTKSVCAYAWSVAKSLRPAPQTLLRSFLLQSRYLLVSTRDESILRARLIAFVEQQCEQKKCKRIIFLIDEAQNLHFSDYDVLIAIFNGLEQRGLKPFFMLVGQPELYLMPDTLLDENKLQTYGRFFKKTRRFSGVDTSAFKVILQGFDQESTTTDGRVLSPMPSRTHWATKQWPITERLTTLLDLPSTCSLALSPFDLSDYRNKNYELLRVPRYCEECLHAGYHATVFQYRALRECPIHRTKLRNVCIACGKTLPRRFYEVACQPFECAECGTILTTTPDKRDSTSLRHQLPKVVEVQKSIEYAKRAVLRSSKLNVRGPISQTESEDAAWILPSIDVLSVRTVEESCFIADSLWQGYDAPLIWADNIGTYLATKQIIETELAPVIDDYNNLSHKLGYPPRGILPTKPALAATAVAFYRWRSMYDRGRAEVLDRYYCKVILAGRPLTSYPRWERVPAGCDTVWESRIAQRLLFTHELYATFAYLLITSKRCHSLRHIEWDDTPYAHPLMPTWRIEARPSGNPLFVMTLRVTKSIFSRLLRNTALIPL